ncbi:MAG: 5'/3'-nucleotidase SurE [Dehalococcoidia bacterium]|nr:5'/3'-nucleotidase SurE [Dehalococcoidia bacterium]
MKILLTNDDGIRAPGLWAAAGALRQVGEVFVVAPEQEQSGVGASLTLHSAVRIAAAPVDPGLSGDPGRIEDGDASHPVVAYSVGGTPGDSCVLGLESVVGAVDLVVSGINSGSNLGWDVVVSGTVGAAIQGYVRGYPTIAISVGAVHNPQFEGAGRLLRLLAQRLSQAPASPGFFLNINVPSIPVERISGVEVTRLGRRSYAESVREEGSGTDKRYRISRNRPVPGEPQPGTDVWALKRDLISITPLEIVLGHQEKTLEVEGLVSGIFAQLLDHPC